MLQLFLAEPDCDEVLAATLTAQDVASYRTYYNQPVSWLEYRQLLQRGDFANSVDCFIYFLFLSARSFSAFAMSSFCNCIGAGA